MDITLNRVSIIIPTYNRAYCLGNAIQSALNQTYKDFELIVCDDCSTDNTEEVVKSFKDTRIIYSRNESNCGLPVNRNRGLALSKSPLVLFWEDDLLFKEDGLEVLVKTYDELSLIYSIGAISPKAIEDSKQGKLLELETMVANDVRNKLQKPSYISKWTGLIFKNLSIDSELVETELVNPWSLFNKRAIENIGGYSKLFGKLVGYSHEETDLFVRLAKNHYGLFYQSKSISYHKHTSKGGTRVGQLRYAWNYVGAHTIFLVKNYNIRSVYMLPFCALYVMVNLLKYSFKLALK